VISVLTPLPVLLPLLGAAAALLIGGRHPGVQRTLSIAVLTALLAVSVVLLFVADADGAAAVSVGAWPVPLGIVLVVDRLSALMLVVAATVALGVLVFAVGQGAADGDEETPISIFTRRSSCSSRAWPTRSSPAICSTSTSASRSC